MRCHDIKNAQIILTGQAGRRGQTYVSHPCITRIIEQIGHILDEVFRGCSCRLPSCLSCHVAFQFKRDWRVEACARRSSRETRRWRYQCLWGSAALPCLEFESSSWERTLARIQRGTVIDSLTDGRCIPGRTQTGREPCTPMAQRITMHLLVHTMHSRFLSVEWSYCS